MHDVHVFISVVVQHQRHQVMTSTKAQKWRKTWNTSRSCLQFPVTMLKHFSPIMADEDGSHNNQDHRLDLANFPFVDPCGSCLTSSATSVSMTDDLRRECRSQANNVLLVQPSIGRLAPLLEPIIGIQIKSNLDYVTGFPL